MTRCFTCLDAIEGEPAFIRGQFPDVGNKIEMPVCSRECVEQCEWVDGLEVCR